MFVVHTCTCVCVEFRGQLVGICSRLSWAANPQIMIRRLLLVMNVQPQFMRVPLALITYFHPSLFYVSALGLFNLAFCIPYFSASLVSDWPLASHSPSFSLLSAPPLSLLCLAIGHTASYQTSQVPQAGKEKQQRIFPSLNKCSISRGAHICIIKQMSSSVQK